MYVGVEGDVFCPQVAIVVASLVSLVSFAYRIRVAWLLHKAASIEATRRLSNNKSRRSADGKIVKPADIYINKLTWELDRFKRELTTHAITLGSVVLKGVRPRLWSPVLQRVPLHGTRSYLYVCCCVCTHVHAFDSACETGRDRCECVFLRQMSHFLGSTPTCCLPPIKEWRSISWCPPHQLLLRRTHAHTQRA